MATKVLKAWSEFQSKVVDPFCRKEREKCADVWFRGQSDAEWPLRTTLDRYRIFAADEERARFYQSIIKSFRNEIVGMENFSKLPDGDALDLLARHHGLPSTLLDWSRSPYVAAYFAFETALLSARKSNVAIWAVNRQRLSTEIPIDFVEDRKLLWYNRRALEQAGVFMRIRSVAKPAEDLLERGLTKYEIPAAEARLAMRYLEAMNITASTLFRDLDGAARTVKIRNLL